MIKQITKGTESIEFSENPYKGLEFGLGRIFVQVGASNYLSLDGSETKELFKVMKKYYER